VHGGLWTHVKPSLASDWDVLQCRHSSTASCLTVALATPCGDCVSVATTIKSRTSVGTTGSVSTSTSCVSWGDLALSQLIMDVVVHECWLGLHLMREYSAVAIALCTLLLLVQTITSLVQKVLPLLQTMHTVYA
jgi:hypothetical protein